MVTALEEQIKLHGKWNLLLGRHSNAYHTALLFLRCYSRTTLKSNYVKLEF